MKYEWSIFERTNKINKNGVSLADFDYTVVLSQKHEQRKPNLSNKNTYEMNINSTYKAIEVKMESWGGTGKSSTVKIGYK